MDQQQAQIEAGTMVEYWDCPSVAWETVEYLGVEDGWHIVRRANGKERGVASVRFEGRTIHA